MDFTFYTNQQAIDNEVSQLKTIMNTGFSSRVGNLFTTMDRFICGISLAGPLKILILS